MNDEIEVIENSNTWDVVNFPIRKGSIGEKWVYRTKFNEKGNVENNKARLVVKGFTHSLS